MYFRQPDTRSSALSLLDQGLFLAMRKCLIFTLDECKLSEIEDSDSGWSCLRLEFLTSFSYDFKLIMKEVVNGSAS